MSGLTGDDASTGTKSSFVIDKQGHVVTIFHVVHGGDARRISGQVKLLDGSALQRPVSSALSLANDDGRCCRRGAA